MPPPPSLGLLPTFSKRHASFDSPREVPLPSPSRPRNEYFPAIPSDSDNSSPTGFPVFEDHDSVSSTTSASPPPPPSSSTRTTTISTPIFPFSRPYSLPSAQPTPPPPPPPPSSYQQTPLDTHWSDRYSSASLPLPANVPFHTLLRANDPDPPRPRHPHPSTINHYPYAHPPPPPTSDSSGSNSASGSSSASRSPLASPSPELKEEDEDPDHLNRHTHSDHTNDQNPRLRRRRSSGSPSRLPPAQTLLAPPPRPATSPQPTTDHSSSLNCSTSTYPAPDPPTILPPTASPGPFLSHAPPPPDSWIEVETSAGEYRLVVRLPGFRRDGITLATKRRRVLHVVADKWEGGGGHFERRISFGYDADLVQVRAEFDGEMLRINIPRRLPPVDLWPQQRQGPVGRLG